MNKFSNLVLFVCACLLVSVPTSTNAKWFDSSWMYLSTSPDHYNPGLDDPHWESGTFKDVYLIVENPATDWFEGDAYVGVEFSVHYPPSVALALIESPEVSSFAFLGTCDNERCDGAIAAGELVPTNFWTAVHLRFFTVGSPENILLTLSYSTHFAAHFEGTPGWYYLNTITDQSLSIPATRVSQGSGIDYKPDWYAGVVLLNYNPATISPEMLNDLGDRVQDPNHPLWMHAVPVEESTWGAIKAAY